MNTIRNKKNKEEAIQFVKSVKLEQTEILARRKKIDSCQNIDKKGKALEKLAGD